VFFIDTVYCHALVNARDQWRPAALRWERWLDTARPRHVTTEFVLVEFANGLAAVRFRRQALLAVAAIRSNPRVEVVPASTKLLDSALSLYQDRPDKDWSLTDCASFIVMAERGLTDALTSDEHFRQAGFRPLLLDDPPVASS
jgi:uncharacterized protein